jgi:hypothetical protein
MLPNRLTAQGCDFLESVLSGHLEVQALDVQRRFKCQYDREAANYGDEECHVLGYDAV